MRDERTKESQSLSGNTRAALLEQLLQFRWRKGPERKEIDIDLDFDVMNMNYFISSPCLLSLKK